MLFAAALLFVLAAPETPAQAPDEYCFLATSHSANRVMILDPAGVILWDAAINHPQEAQVLPSGNILTSYLTGLREIALDTKAVVWDYAVPDGAQNPLARCLGKNHFLLGMEGPCIVREIDSSGTLLHEAQLSAKSSANHGQFRLGEKTPSGTYLLPMLNDNEVREFASDGALLRTLSGIPAPVSASMLPDGRMLVGHAGGVRIFDPKGNEIWKLDGAGLGVALGHITAVLLLEDGGMILGNYAASGPDILGISQDKRLLWTLDIPGVFNVPEVQLLDRQWRPAKNVLNRPAPPDGWTTLPR